MGHFLGFQFEYNFHILMLKLVEETKLIFIRPFRLLLDLANCYLLRVNMQIKTDKMHFLVFQEVA